MTQESLFNARFYVKRAYESLVLAYDAHELEELHALKNAVLRGLITVEVIAAEQLSLSELTQSESDAQF